MKEDCKNYDICRKCVDLCNDKCPEYLSAEELQKEHKEQLMEDLKNYQSKEYH
jgi:hypothetical protein